MTKKELGRIVSSELERLYPDAACSLEYDGEAWKLLVMARLSAQCTDARVNIVSKELFKKYPTQKALANANLAELENIVRPCGLYKTKAKSILEAARIIEEMHGGEVPSDMDTLLALPGIGRKIANLMLGDVFGQPNIVTDTHCIRICGRLGFYPESEKTPEKIERILDKCIEKQIQSDFCHRIVLFGRDICTARSPKCDECPLKTVCKHVKGKK
ncbi:MAG: endonuclease III [Clostridia bacterium]|nr:endonuclease III [Clostridia bacterium]